jgi:hypothetical protein
MKWSLTLPALLACLACAHPRPVTLPEDRSASVILVPTGQLAPSFVAQQKLHGRYGEREFSLDVVVQLAQGKLTLVGLTPFGTRAFVLTQEGTEVKLEKFIDRELPFDPRYVLDDVHRVFFRKLPGAQGSGEFSGEDHGEHITERWQNGVLVQRRFTRPSAGDNSPVVITFRGAPSPVVAPEVTLESKRFGYTLDVHTLTQQLVP